MKIQTIVKPGARQENEVVDGDGRFFGVQFDVELAPAGFKVRGVAFVGVNRHSRRAAVSLARHALSFPMVNLKSELSSLAEKALPGRAKPNLEDYHEAVTWPMPPICCMLRYIGAIYHRAY
jgi:hypothetical protein